MQRFVTAAEAGLIACHSCTLVTHPPAPEAPAQQYRCPRCDALLHSRKPHSIARTWALLLAAYILYLPANLLPIMDTASLRGAQSDTILSGVVYLWTSGSWPLAALVFIASITVPLLKLLALTLLLVTAQRRSRWQPRQRAVLYRLIEFVGRWSMLDIFVVTILAALVQLNTLATIKAGPAAAAFGAVVVLTMLAARTFDPRLIWDPTGGNRG